MLQQFCSSRLFIGLIASMTLSAFQPATASYPERPVTMVVPYNAGGGTDVLARIIAAGASKVLQQTIVVENKPGASGMIGSNAVAKSRPDGYTLELTAADTHGINPHVYSNIPYDARKDFVAVAQIGYNPYALLVSSQLSIKSIQDFIALAKSQPGKLTYASWGVGSSSHVAMEMLKVNQGLDLLHVPYTGAAPALQALMGGQVDALFVPLSIAKPSADSGKTILIGLAAPKRSVGSPEIPTLLEQGIDVTASPWIGVLAPAQTPQSVIDTLSGAFLKAVDDAEVTRALTGAGLEMSPRSSEEFSNFMVEDFARWGDTVKATNIKAD